MNKSWRYLRSGYGSKNADFDIVNESGGRVASTPYEDKARVIAAAPDLLDALKGLLVDIEDYQRLNHLGGENNHWQVISRAAIAKAEGK